MLGIALEGDAGREVEARLEHGHAVARRKHDILALIGVERGCVVRAERIRDGGRQGHARQGENQSKGRPRKKVPSSSAVAMPTA